MRSFRITVAISVIALGVAPACFDQLGPDPTFPSDAGFDATNTSDGATDGSTIADVAVDTAPVGPAALLSATILDFGEVGCGSSATAPQTLTIANVGSAPLAFSVTLDNPTAFTVTPSTGGTIPVGGSTTLTVTALRVPSTATAAQTIVGGLTIDSNDATRSSQAVRLSVTPMGGTITITPQSIDFGQAPPGTPVAVPVLITNTGNSMVGVAFTPPSDPEFALWPAATQTESVPPGQSLTNTVVTFTPAEGGASSAPMTILGGTCGISPNEIDFTGAVSPSSVTAISTTELDFSTPCMGASTPQPVGILNESSTETLTITNIVATNGYAATPTTLTIAPRQTGTIAVTAPAWTTGTSSGPATSGLLSFDTSDGELPDVEIPLTETFVGADLSFTDSNGDVLAVITYPGVPVGQAQTFPFQVLNTGNAAVTIVPGAVQSPPWSWAIPGGQSVSAQGEAPLSLTFAPTTNGTQTTTVSVTAMGAVCTAPGPFTATGTGTGGPDGGSSAPDAGAPDASPLDASAPDATPLDASVSDSGFFDSQSSAPTIPLDASAAGD